MINGIRSWRAQATPEQEILLNRLVMGTTAGLCAFFFAFDPVIFAAFVAFLSFNTCLFVMQKQGVWRQEERWFAGIILDVLMAFAVMLRAPEQMAVFYPIILWMILGNGFRYGIKWLFVASVVSTIAFGFVVASTVYWQQNSLLGYSLCLALLIIPAYCSTLIRKISHAKEQAETASRAKSYFLASVSHELRTPLNAIIGYGHHLRQADMPRNQKEMIEASVLAGEHLLHLIEQLIEVAKSGTGNAEVKKSMFSPTSLLTEIRDIMAVRIEEKGLVLRLQAEPLSDRVLDGPGDVLRNILLNLVGNAVKFTEAGTISVHSGLTEEEGTYKIWFTVADTGIGIADTAIERIFQPFQQADDTVMNRFGGTGLGLAICKQLAEQVNGTVTAHSVIGQGSTFTVEVPVDLAVDARHTVDTKVGETVRILSLGDLEPDLLAEAQSLDNFVVQHIDCRSAVEAIKALAKLDLSQFNVALMAENLAREIGADHPIWAIFADAEVAPVLVATDLPIDLEDVALRAAFASVLTASPGFDELRSAIRIGCSFARHFRLPVPENLPAISITTSRNILVADDNRTNRNVLAAILGSAGHQVTLVTDGDEALEALDQSAFDILLLDINMPRLNGIDACVMWRQIEGSRQHLPIIGVTADATVETEQKCQNAGMDLRLTKPVDARLLLSTIERFCDSDKQARGSSPGSIEDPLSVVVPFKGAAPPMSDAIDLAQIDYLMSIGDAVFVANMIDGFAEDTAQTIEPLRKAVAAGDVHEFRFCTHAFKSSGNNMGARRLAALCGRLEKITEADFAEHRHVYLDKIEQEISRVSDALTQLRAEGPRNSAINRR